MLQIRRNKNHIDERKWYVGVERGGAFYIYGTSDWWIGALWLALTISAG